MTSENLIKSKVKPQKFFFFCKVKYRLRGKKELLGYAFMYLIIKYFKEDLAQLASLHGNTLHSSLISSGWKITLAFGEYDFPPGFGGQRAWWPAYTKNAVV